VTRGLGPGVERRSAGQCPIAVGHDQEPREERLERLAERGLARPAERLIAARDDVGRGGVRDLGRRTDGDESRDDEVRPAEVTGCEPVRPRPAAAVCSDDRMTEASR
jgi:hypothetical protein